MKKLFPIVALSGLLVLGGCSDASTTITNNKDVLISVGDQTITTGDVYNVLQISGNITPVVTALNKQIIEVAVPISEELETAAKAELEDVKAEVGSDNWDAFLEDSGYADEEDFYQNAILYTLREPLITSAYVKEKQDELFEQLKPLQLQVIAINNQEQANEAYQKLKDGTAFEDLLSYANAEGYVTDTSIYTNEMLPSSLWTKIEETEDGTYVDAIGNDDTMTTYFLVNKISSEVANYEDEAITTIANSTNTNDEGLTMEQTALKYYLDEISYGIYDATIYSALLGTNPAYTRD